MISCYNKKVHLRDVCVRYIHEHDFPLVVKEWLKALEKEKDIGIRHAIRNVQVDNSTPHRLTFELDWMSIQCKDFLAYAVMKAYYGFRIHWDTTRIFPYSIGGYETEEYSAKSIPALLAQLNRLARQRGEL